MYSDAQILFLRLYKAFRSVILLDAELLKAEKHFLCFVSDTLLVKYNSRMSPATSEVSLQVTQRRKGKRNWNVFQEHQCIFRNIQCISRIRTPLMCISEALASWILYLVHWVIVIVDFKSFKAISCTNKSCWGQSKFNNMTCWIPKHRGIILREFSAAVNCFNEQSLIFIWLLQKTVLVNICVCIASGSLSCRLSAHLCLSNTFFLKGGSLQFMERFHIAKMPTFS